MNLIIAHLNGAPTVAIKVTIVAMDIATRFGVCTTGASRSLPGVACRRMCASSIGG